MARFEAIELDPVPCNESCQQVGPNYRPELARIEAECFANQLRALEYPGIRIKVSAHYGNYTTYGVNILFNPESEESTDSAYTLESKLPEYWTEESKYSLRIMTESQDD